MPEMEPEDWMAPLAFAALQAAATSARRARFGWDYWGDQSLSTAEIGAA